jgi:hypothetical protein
MFICKRGNLFPGILALAVLWFGLQRSIAALPEVVITNLTLSGFSADIRKMDQTNFNGDVTGGSVTFNNIRIQFISDSLVRVELRGPNGFEDRSTFHIADRSGPGAHWKGVVWDTNGVLELKTAGYSVWIPVVKATTIAGAGETHTFRLPNTLLGLAVASANGDKILYYYAGGLTNNAWLPAPSEHPQVWSFADTPRLVPPKWGLTPPPKPMPNGGWDLGNNAPDVYVFIPHGDYFQLRRDFLKLTGPAEMPPLYTFGAWDSRWYDYSEATALKQIDDYRARNIPLDNLVIDTGWRQGASTGYQPNTNLFPNLTRFFKEAHAKKVHVMINDHPEPVSTNALSAEELDYRFNGLSTLLDEGLDVWWYDRNWRVHLIPPATNLDKEVWGMRLYHDTTARVRPEERPFIMANVDGIDNGIRKRPMDVAAHRFPIQWTGDIGPDYDVLRRAVENAVYSGAQSLFPYESDDLGGHIANPTPEEYIRWIEYGALSPVYRPHCTHNLERMPWTFGPEVENDARNYENMRYRLLPVFYAAAHENYETGEPILRRLDLYYPQYSEASRNDEYLLGQYILVSPVLEGAMRNVPKDWLSSDGQPGLHGEYFADENLSGTASFARTDAAIDFNWDHKSPRGNFPRTNFSGRWTGTLFVPASVGDVTLATMEDDGARVWVDGNLVIDAWGPHDSATTVSTNVIAAGVAHQIRIEYQQLDFNARLRLMCQPVNSPDATREAWIPPGQWIDAWNGEILSGPMMVTNRVPLDKIPMWIKSGAVLPLAPKMQYTGEKPWDPITLDIYPAAGETNSATLYEDDTLTTAYQRGKFRTTQITCSADDASKMVRVDISAAVGKFSGELKKRGWILRVHCPPHWPMSSNPGIIVNGRKTTISYYYEGAEVPIDTQIPFLDDRPGNAMDSQDGQLYKIPLSPESVTKTQAVEISFQPRP